MRESIKCFKSEKTLFYPEKDYRKEPIGLLFRHFTIYTINAQTALLISKLILYVTLLKLHISMLLMCDMDKILDTLPAGIRDEYLAKSIFWDKL